MVNRGLIDKMEGYFFFFILPIGGTNTKVLSKYCMRTEVTKDFLSRNP